MTMIDPATLTAADYPLEFNDPKDDYGPPDVRLVFGDMWREIVIETEAGVEITVTPVGGRVLLARLATVLDLLDKVVEMAEDAS